jgi:predicted nucleic acid-binding protein
MNSLVCVDACLALKLVLGEDDSPRVIALWRRWIDENITVTAPPLLAYEVTSVLRTKVYRRLITAEAGEEAFRVIHAQGIYYLSPENLHIRAWELAKRLDRPAAYDAHYLALAEILGCEFWTADQRLYNTSGDTLPWVRYLGEDQPSSERR